MQEERNINSRHSITIEKRAVMNMTGVKDVLSYDDSRIEALTDFGVIIISGEGLHISQLNIEDGSMNVDGTICGVNYENEGSIKDSFFGRMFR